MLKLLLLLAVAAVVAVAADDDDDDEVCFDYLGCFSMGTPWKTLLRPLPAPLPPDQISTRFYLYTSDSNERFDVQTRPEPSVEGSSFDGSKPTFFITHGFSSDGNSTWLADMKDALLSRVDGNVFLTDWGEGASLLNYFQVAANTRVVAREMSRLLSYLIKNRALSVSNVHLIGHSLGAQISSYAAKNITGIGRLTALDPAQPGFEGFVSEVRLDPDDAVYVEVVHSDAKPLIPFLGFGMMGPYGHNDYYLNGGYQQPGCIIPKPAPKITSFTDLAKLPVEVISNFVSCPHSRSYKVYTASIWNDNCTMWGHPVTLLADAAGLLSRGFLHRYLTPSKDDCNIKTCSPLGLRSIDYPARGTHNVATTSDYPYCIAQPEVDAKMARSLEEYKKPKAATTKRPRLLEKLIPRRLPKLWG